MQNHMIAEREESHFELLFCKETLNQDFLAKIWTRKLEKDLQLIMLFLVTSCQIHEKKPTNTQQCSSCNNTGLTL